MRQMQITALILGLVGCQGSNVTLGVMPSTQQASSSQDGSALDAGGDFMDNGPGYPEFGKVPSPSPSPLEAAPLMGEGWGGHW